MWTHDINKADSDEGDELPNDDDDHDDDELGMETLLTKDGAPTHRDGFPEEVEIGSGEWQRMG